jgi:hypothetical protein
MTATDSTTTTPSSLRRTVTPPPEFPADSLTIRPWPDEVIDTVGVDPRSYYVETFWLGVLGPSTTWLLRRLVNGLEASPAGFELDLSDTARQLGLGDKGGRHSPFLRALTRCVQFDLAQLQDGRTLAVRRKLPPLNRRQVAHLPESLQERHRDWQESQLGVKGVEAMRRRSRQLDLSLLELGDDLETTERQLLRWRFHPAMAHESAAWAWARHRQALAAAASGPTDESTPGSQAGPDAA